jgi:hypothetical protein
MSIDNEKPEQPERENMTGSGFHRAIDPFVSDHMSYSHHPMVDIDAEESHADELRDARLRGLSILSNFAVQIADALTQPGVTVLGIETKFWGCCLAIGLPVCDGQSVTSIASRLGIKRATLSKLMVAFCESNDLPASRYMKNANTRDTFHDARLASIAAHNGHNGTELPSVPPIGRSV